MSRRVTLPELLKANVVYQYRRWAVDLGAPARAFNLNPGKPAVFHDIRPSFIYGDKKTAEAMLKGHFEYGGQKLDVGAQGDPWTVVVPSTRFASWLHGFHWLGDLAVSKDKNAAIRARHLVDKWIAVYGKWNPFAWEPDILADRLFHWLALWSPLLTGDSMSEAAQIRRSSVMRQLKRLRKTYKRTSPGLPRLKAAAVLAMAGARLKEKSDGFLGRGLDWLDDEIGVQVLPDGGHVSRAPGQALESLQILLTLDSLLQARGVEGSRAVSRAIDRLAPVIPFFTAADGKLFCFNGSGEGEKAYLKAIKKAAPETTSKSFGYCPHTGYQRIEAEGTVLLVDTGATTPRPFDQQAHLSPLAFELSTELGRLVVNCGWNEQQPHNFRRAVRATAAHSNLILDNRSAGKLLKEGWGSKRLGEVVDVEAGPVMATRKEQVSGTWLETSHDGYRQDIGLDASAAFLHVNRGQ